MGFTEKSLVPGSEPANTIHRTRRIPSSGFRRVFHALVLLSVAAILTTTVPSPWSIFNQNVREYVLVDPADEWQDNVWPIRQSEPWDISTDFPFPRTLEYDVTEGTWLRLDVHPKNGDIVFDMLGDLYCIPASEAFDQAGPSTARPVLLGVPHDSDAHFSPDGDSIVFRSDAELGIDNIWITPWTGCASMDLRPHHPAAPLRQARAAQKADEALLASGVKETAERRSLRLLREGRSEARRVTNETYRFVSDARWHPSGSSLIATKWYTSSRSLGAGEGWQYTIPSAGDTVPIGSGKRVLGRTLPRGWTAEEYGDLQIGPEQFIWSGNDTLIYAKNSVEASTFEYSKDVHSGIYSIFSFNLTSKRTATLVDANPGGASRPELSRDGRTLAFVRRFRASEVLVLKDLVTGTIQHIWDGLTYDATAIYAPMGTYPSFSFTPDDSAIIIWAAGQIYSVPLSTNSLGERGLGGTPVPIRFKAHIEKQVAETRKIDGELDYLAHETANTTRVTSFEALKADAKGHKVVFQAAGTNYVQILGKDHATSIPTVSRGSAYYSPSFIEGTDHTLVIHSRWSDANFTSFEVADLDKHTAYPVTGLPLGRYLVPTVSSFGKSKRNLAFVKTGGDLLSGNVVATAKPGLYIGTIDLKPNKGKEVQVTDLKFVPSEISTGDVIRLEFVEDSKLLAQQSSLAFIIDLAGTPDDVGKPPHSTLATGRMSSELLVSTTKAKTSIFDWSTKKADAGYVADNVAFIDFMHVYVASGASIAEGESVWSRPGNATKGLARLSLDGGHDLAWSGDGRKLFWLLGPYLHSLEVAKLDKCSKQIKDDPSTFGIACVKKLLSFQEIVVEHSTDIARVKAQSEGSSFVIYNATLLTMASGNLEQDLVPNASLVIKDGVISSVGSLQDIQIPHGASVYNANGGFVVPGFIDMHAHWSGFRNPHPASSWEMTTFLAYGVTTLHNPSSDNVRGFSERNRIERGLFIGPRIFHTGDVIYGAASPDIHQDIINMDEARSALVRIKAEGGPTSTSYKNYQLPSRASRQRLLLAARNLTMLCVPEGGMNWDWNLAFIQDGMTTVEHAIPVPVLHEDALKFFAWSGTGNTPTHIVNYGGAFGEQYLWANRDIPNDPKLRTFTRHDILEGLTESTARPKSSYGLFNTSISVAKMVNLGLRAHIGAHGEPPLGLMYHTEIFFAQQGGLSNYQVLQAATSWAAQTLGIFPALGSLTQGKLADLVIYPSGVDLLGGDIRLTEKLEYVVRGGRVWETASMTEVFPVKGRRQGVPPFNPDSRLK